MILTDVCVCVCVCECIVYFVIVDINNSKVLWEKWRFIKRNFTITTCNFTIIISHNLSAD